MWIRADRTTARGNPRDKVDVGPRSREAEFSVALARPKPATRATREPLDDRGEAELASHVKAEATPARPRLATRAARAPLDDRGKAEFASRVAVDALARPP
ncbi:hypothetical protein [Stackebrandtia nassauensis]|uniref:hypothetical protein n=1 Tax=Stackebrandtia nassauensis TaxID=283811 RepID=UPI0005A217C2|nr:hypothetical protein [Stackebrandtia nassauensis]